MASSLRKFAERYRFPLLCALGLRAATSAWVALLWWFLDPHFPYEGKGIVETYHLLPVHQGLIGRMLLDAWLRWDAVHYMNLAHGGYASAGAADMNFWPLYPYVVRVMRLALFGDTVLAGLIVSTLATAGAMVLFWQLTREAFDDERLANWTVLAWAVYPTALFLVAPFTDSLFACLALASLLAMRRKCWLLSGGLAALAGLARSQGILLAAPLLLSMVLEWRKDRRIIPAMPVGLALAPLGTGLFFLWRSAAGLPDIFASFNVYTKARFVDPFSGLYLAAAGLVRDFSLIQLTELLSVVFFLGILIWMARRAEFRGTLLPLLVYGFLNISFNLTKHIENASPLQSSNRYVLNVLPAFIGIAWLLLKLPAQRRTRVVAISAGAAMATAALYTLWVFVG